MGDLIAGVVDLIGGGMTNQAAWDRQQSANAFNAQQSQVQMDFQKEMRKTQYQTAVEDMKAAGLNPMLAYSQGGAGTPSGAAASSAPPAPVQNILSSANQAYRAAGMNAAQVKLMDEQAKATTAQTEVSRTQALKNIADEAKSNQDTATSKAAEQVSRDMLAKIAQEIATSKAQANMYSAQAAETSARTRNELAQDPWYVNYAKKFANSAQKAWEEKIKQSNKYLYNGSNVSVKGQ